MESVLGCVGGGMMMVVSGGMMDGGAGGCLRGTGACVLMFPAAVGSLRAAVESGGDGFGGGFAGALVALSAAASERVVALVADLVVLDDCMIFLKTLN